MLLIQIPPRHDASTAAAIAQSQMAKIFLERSRPLGSSVDANATAEAEHELFTHSNDLDADGAESQSGSDRSGQGSDRSNEMHDLPVSSHVSVGDGNSRDAFVPMPDKLVACTALADVTAIWCWAQSV
jgi:hypothetical protein